MDSVNKVSKADWRDEAGYYHSKFGRCCICNSNKKIGMEPRFAYYICKKHSKMSPVDIAKNSAF